MKGFIYCIINNINQKKYVGKTLRTIEERFKEHCKDYQKILFEKRPLYSAMNKYGIENFSIYLLEEVDIQDLSNREIYWINQMDTYHNGYNATLGGDGKILYDYSLFVEEYKNGMLIKEIAEKYGCDTHPIETALKLQNIDGKLNALNKQRHKVAQYSLDNEYIQSFDSIRDAARFLISRGHNGKITSIATNIGRVVKGTRYSCEGYIWKQI